jgi:transposase
MAQIQEIKVLQAQGWSVSAIAAALQIDRKTVRKSRQQTDFSAPLPAMGVERPSTRDPYKPTIDAWLADDAQHWHKQRHTAQRVSDRLREALPDFAVSYPTVRRTVRPRRRAAPTTGTLELVWEPGEAAPVDCGQADVIDHGECIRRHFLCVSFPYSQAGYIP